jgi:hypothetical protein
MTAYRSGRMLKSLLAGAACALALSAASANAQDFSLLDRSFSKALPGLASQKPAADILRRAKAGWTERRLPYPSSTPRAPCPARAFARSAPRPAKTCRRCSTSPSPTG